MVEPAGGDRSRISIARVLIIGSILIVISGYWVVGVENRIVYELTDFSIYPTVIFVLFLLALVNLILARFLKKFSLSPAELATIYIMLSIATSLFGHDMMRQLIPMMTNPFWFATPENEWEDLFFRYIPKWLTVDNQAALEEYYEGESNFFTAQNIQAWLVPVLAWAGFIVVFLFGALCINLIVRKQWTENEKLSYPIIRLPLELSSSPKFFSNRLMWIGFGITAGIELLAGLHFLRPVIPAFGIKWDIGSYLVTKPWSAMRPLHVNIYGFAMGLAYFMPLSLSFSLWFFHIFWKFQLAFFSVLGWRTGGGWQGDQRLGAWMGIGILAVLTTRKHIIETLVKAIKGGTGNGTYRFAYLGAIFSVAFMLVFWSQAGVSPWAIFIYFGIYLTLSVAITRMRAELGPPTHELHTVEPDRMMVTIAGTKSLGPQNLTALTILDWIAYGYRSHPMPHQLEGFKISERLRMKGSTLIVAMMVAGVVGTIISFGAHLGFYYRYSGSFMVWGRGPFDRLGKWLTHPVTRDTTVIKQMGFGFLFTFFLMAMSRRYLWWHFHPVGYAVASGWAIGWMWFSVLMSWLIKKVILSYGGSKAYRTAMPLFMGLILGQFFIGSLWSVIGIIVDKQMYTLFP